MSSRILNGVFIYFDNSYVRGGISYDIRTKPDVINDLVDSGLEAHLNVFPVLFLQSDGLVTPNGHVFPLGGISNITTILNNESGYYPIIETDEYGFHNPKGLYEKDKIDVVLIGDSFTEGHSVDSDQLIPPLKQVLFY